MVDDVVTLKEYFDARLEDLLREIHKAEHILNMRLESMNEFRESLKETQSLMVTRVQFEQMFHQQEIRIRMLENRQAYTIGAAAALASVISIGISLI